MFLADQVRHGSWGGVYFDSFCNRFLLQRSGCVPVFWLLSFYFRFFLLLFFAKCFPFHPFYRQFRSLRWLDVSQKHFYNTNEILRIPYTSDRSRSNAVVHLRSYPPPLLDAVQDLCNSTDPTQHKPVQKSCRLYRQVPRGNMS